MSEKIIDEVMGLVDSLWESGISRESWEAQCAKHEAIRAKLREVLDHTKGRALFIAANKADSAGHHWSGAPARAFFELAEEIRNIGAE